MEEANKEIERLKAEREAREGSDPGLPMLAVYLLAQEHARRKGDYAFVPENATRSKKDADGTYWRVATVLPSDEDVAAVVGYDPLNPPYRDFIMISAQPEKGRYDLALAELDRIEREWPATTRTVAQIRQKVAATAEQAASPQKQRIADELVHAGAEMAAMKARHEEAISVVESAFANLYFFKVEDLDKMADYGLRAIPVVVSVPAPRRYSLTIPKYLQGDPAPDLRSVNEVLDEWEALTADWPTFAVKGSGERVKAIYNQEDQRYQVFDGRTMEKWQVKAFDERFEVAVDLPIPA